MCIGAVKLSSPDYKGWEADRAVADYWKRIRDHEKTYESIQNPTFPFIKVMDSARIHGTR
jgi:6-phosphofructo-2-kinase/fructose-2,6-biphosphatase 4